MTITQQLHDMGQSLWLDNITRDLLGQGTLRRYIDTLSVTGLTSNPTIFSNAIRTMTREVGVARYSGVPNGKAEIAVTVSDEWQNKGLGTALMKRLIELARQRGIREFYSVDASGNDHMRKLAQHLGFQCKTDPEDATQVIYTLQLGPA